LTDQKHEFGLCLSYLRRKNGFLQIFQVATCIEKSAFLKKFFFSKKVTLKLPKTIVKLDFWTF